MGESYLYSVTFGLVYLLLYAGTLIFNLKSVLFGRLSSAQIFFFPRLVIVSSFDEEETYKIFVVLKGPPWIYEISKGEY